MRYIETYPLHSSPWGYSLTRHETPPTSKCWDGSSFFPSELQPRTVHRNVRTASGVVSVMAGASANAPIPSRARSAQRRDPSARDWCVVTPPSRRPQTASEKCLGRFNNKIKDEDGTGDYKYPSLGDDKQSRAVPRSRRFDGSFPRPTRTTRAHHRTPRRIEPNPTPTRRDPPRLASTRAPHARHTHADRRREDPREPQPQPQHAR